MIKYGFTGRYVMILIKLSKNSTLIHYFEMQLTARDCCWIPEAVVGFHEDGAREKCEGECGVGFFPEGVCGTDPVLCETVT
jgi:hypothetical protein